MTPFNQYKRTPAASGGEVAGVARESIAARESTGVWLGIAAISVAAFALVVLVTYGGSRGESEHSMLLPTLSALFNATSAAMIVYGLRAIHRGQRRAHKRWMLSAFGVSLLFLVSYLTHHARVGSVPFQGVGLIRTVYFTLLIPHILLAAAIVPLALLTIWRGWKGYAVSHRAIARYTWPIWLFVSISGVLVYVLLYHWPA